MDKDLTRVESILGKQQVVSGSKDKDFILQTKGKVKVQQGDRFIDLLKDGKLNSGDIITIVNTVNDIGKATGFYFVKENLKLYAVVNGTMIDWGSIDGGTTEGVKKLSELEDVYLVNLKNGDLLVYQGGYWVNSLFNIRDLNKLTNRLTDIENDLTLQARYTQRTFKDVMETFNMMFDPEGDYFTDKITPLAVHTAQLIVGTNSQQFSLVNIKFEPNYLGDYNRFGASVIDPNKMGILSHNTITRDDGGFTWNILQTDGNVLTPDFDVTGLDENSAYYVYARCSRDSNVGAFMISTDAIKLEEETGWYTFWVGVLNTPRASIDEAGDGLSEATVTASKVRSFQAMYGYTEIAGNQITTGVIKDTTGNSYWDMINGAFRIGGGASYIWFDSSTGKLFLKGTLTQVDPENGSSVINWRGVFQNSSLVKYEVGDVVYYNGSTYRCKAPVYGNILPTNTTYWELFTSKGSDGSAGAGVQFKYKLTDSTIAPSDPDHDSTWEDGAQGLSPTASQRYLWMATRSKPQGSDWGVWTMAIIGMYSKDGNPGAPGSPGAIGPAMVFRGNYDTDNSSVLYYGNTVRVDVVFYGGTYYVAKTDAINGTTGFRATPPNSSYWGTFGSSFTSVATDLLFANVAAIGGWQFNNLRMWSATNNCYLNGQNDGYPIIAAGSSVINPPTTANGSGTLKTTAQIESSGGFYVDASGKMFCSNAVISGTIYATSGRIGGFNISDNSLTNGPDFNNDASVVYRNDSEGTFAGIGGNVLAPEAGGKVTSMFTNYGSSASITARWGLYVGAANSSTGGVDTSYFASNSAIYIGGGSISGFALTPHVLTTSSTYTLLRSDSVVIKNTSANITINLPYIQHFSEAVSYAEKLAIAKWYGKTYFIKKANIGSITLKSSVYPFYIGNEDAASGSDTFVMNTNAMAVMLVFDSANWQVFYMR